MSRHGGEPEDITAVAERHGISVEELNADIATLTLLGDRAIESDWLLSLRVSQQADQLTLSSDGPFRRPVRLSPEEQLATSLPWRLIQRDRHWRRASRLFSRAMLRARAPRARKIRRRPRSSMPVRFAVRERLAMNIEYAGEGERDVRSRMIHPYQVAEFGISTYIVAWAEDVSAWRRFRLDRIVSASLTTTQFDRRPDFTANQSPTDAFRPGAQVEHVTVRFRKETAPWVAEFFSEHESLPDGSVLVRFDASSTDWLIRRVLEFGADAEVVEPPRYRDAVRRAIA